MPVLTLPGVVLRWAIYIKLWGLTGSGSSSKKAQVSKRCQRTGLLVMACLYSLDVDGGPSRMRDASWS